MAIEKRVRHNKINYVEFAASKMDETKAFFKKVFGWQFTDYGPDYTAYEGRSTDCGFFKSDLCSQTKNGGVLVVFYSEALEETEKKSLRPMEKSQKKYFLFPVGDGFILPNRAEMRLRFGAMLLNTR